MQDQDELLVVRNVSRRVRKRFRQRVLEEDENMGEALTEAMEDWLGKKEKAGKPDFRSLLKSKGFIKVGKKVRWSEQIDQIVYGGTT